MKLRLTKRALSDLRDISAFLHVRNPAAAARVLYAIAAGMELVRNYPNAGRLKRRGIRRLTLPRFNYLIFYTLDEGTDEVQILTIRHSARMEEQ